MTSRIVNAFVVVFAFAAGCGGGEHAVDSIDDSTVPDVVIYPDSGLDQGSGDADRDSGLDADGDSGFGDADVQNQDGAVDPGVDAVGGDQGDVRDSVDSGDDGDDAEIDVDVAGDLSIGDDGFNDTTNVEPVDVPHDALAGRLALDAPSGGIVLGPALPGCAASVVTVTATNIGDGPLSISMIRLQGGVPFMLSGLPGQWPAVLAGDETLQFQVGFQPSAAGPYSDAIIIESDSSGGPQHTIGLFGQCVVCGAGTHKCGCSCMSDSSVESCGSRCTACPTGGVGTTPVCESSGSSWVCGFKCDDGYHRCGSSCKLDSDPNACGTSCTLCVSKANSTRACVDGQCALDCSNGWGDCDGRYDTGCEESLATIVNCGICDRGCTAAPTYGSPACIDGDCSFTCQSGYHREGSACVLNNVDSCCGDDGPGGSCIDCAAMQVPMPPNTTGRCVGLIDFGCELICQPGWFSTSGGVNDGCECHFVSDFDQPGNGIDENCDGSDGKPELAWYVSTSGLDSNAGTAAAPFRTIQRAVNAARADFVKKRVFVAAGIYAESVVIDGSISIYGGLSADGNWTWAESNVTTIRPTVPINTRIIAIDGVNMNEPTWIGNMTLWAGPEVQGGDGSDVYGVKCSKCPGLRLHKLNIIAGPGGNVDGIPVGATGATGGTGGIGGFLGTPGAAGASECGRPGGLGGQGGVFGSGYVGASGVVVNGGGGAGGAGGWYSDGGSGRNGAGCSDLASGGGGAQSVGGVSGGYWLGTAGTTGG